MDGVKGFEIFRCLTEYTSDGLYVFDTQSRRFIIANDTLVLITGYSQEELLSPDFDPRRLVHIDDRSKFDFGDAGDPKNQDERVEVRLITKAKKTRYAECSSMEVPFGDQIYILGSIRDITDRKNLETKLKDEVALQRRNTIETAKSSVRIYQLTEKIKNVPKLTTALLNATTEEELLKVASRSLCEQNGLGYADVSVYLVEGETLRLAHSTCKTPGKRYSLGKASRYARAIHECVEIDRGGTTIIPLKSRDDVLGLLEVRYDEKERVLFDESESVKQGQRDIVRTIAHTMGLMIDNLRLYRTVRQQAIIDELTQTFNRRYFDKKVQDEFIRASRYRRDLSIVIIDIDNFKGINDSFGHLQGDRVLQETADIFRKNTRDVDTICRFGGDEFVLLFPETNRSRAQAKAETLRQLIEANGFTCLGDPAQKLSISISIGVASLTPRTRSQDDLFKAADRALYEAKRLGRNLVCTADS